MREEMREDPQIESLEIAFSIKRMKEFAPKSFKKVDGQWHLREMRIEDLKSGSKTTLQFSVGEE